MSEPLEMVSDEFAFLSQYNNAQSAQVIFKRLDFTEKEEYSNSPKLMANIECLYGDNRHIPTYPNK